MDRTITFHFCAQSPRFLSALQSSLFCTDPIQDRLLLEPDLEFPPIQLVIKLPHSFLPGSIYFRPFLGVDVLSPDSNMAVPSHLCLCHLFLCIELPEFL